MQLPPLNNFIFILFWCWQPISCNLAPLPFFSPCPHPVATCTCQPPHPWQAGGASKIQAPYRIASNRIPELRTTPTAQLIYLCAQKGAPLTHSSHSPLGPAPAACPPNYVILLTGSVAPQDYSTGTGLWVAEHTACTYLFPRHGRLGQLLSLGCCPPCLPPPQCRPRFFVPAPHCVQPSAAANRPILAHPSPVFHVVPPCLATS